MDDEAPLFRSLFDPPPDPPPDPPVDNSIEAKFKVFHKDNPHVYKYFIMVTFRCIKKMREGSGKKDRFGARLAYEQMRWDHRFETTDEQYKINDHFIAYYARLFIADHPEFAETEEKPCLFEFRTLRSRSKP